MLASCAELIHALPGRWRYRLRSATPIQWDQLQQELETALPSSSWRWRLNRHCSTLLLEAKGGEQHQQQQGWQSLVAALDRSGATTPEPEVVQVKVHVVRDQPSRVKRWLLAPANLISFLAASGLLSLAALLVLGGIVGLILPLAPGLPLLLLAVVLVETAFKLRRPFTTAAAA
jgi:hypothetical protein